MTTILVADHNLSSLKKIEETLNQHGYDVESVRDSNHVVEAARHYLPDLIILDLELPGSNSLILCHEIRSQAHLTHVPVLFVTAQSQDVVRALDAGGDDIITKPYANRELLARVRALLRRANRVPQLHLLKIDTVLRQAWVDRTLIDLTPTEFDLLEYLCRYHEDYHTSSDLLELVWRYPSGVGDPALVRNHIHNLRRKLEINPNRPQIIVSLHGRGYRVNAQLLTLANA
jgi:DNA-binding response OmpR family regulator